MLRYVVACVAVLLMTGVSNAQEGANYPTKPIRMILPITAGSGSDVLGRLMAEELTKRLGQNVVVENIPAAAGTVGINQLAKSRPDGYTIGLGSAATILVAPVVRANVPYDPVADLVPIGRIGDVSAVLVVTNDFPANNLQEFLEVTKQSQNLLQYASPGLGSTPHICAELLVQDKDARLKHIPYAGTGASVTAIIAGELQIAFIDTATLAGVIETAKIKPLALCARPTPAFPDVKTYKEQGVDFDQWTGWAIYAPAGIPEFVVEKISAALKEIVEEPTIAKRLLDLGVAPNFVSGAEQLETTKHDIEVLKAIVQEAGIRVE